METVILIMALVVNYALWVFYNMAFDKTWVFLWTSIGVGLTWLDVLGAPFAGLYTVALIFLVVFGWILSTEKLRLDLAEKFDQMSGH